MNDEEKQGVAKIIGSLHAEEDKEMLEAVERFFAACAEVDISPIALLELYTRKLSESAAKAKKPKDSKDAN